MWTFTAYILRRLSERGIKELSFDGLRRLIFHGLWRRRGIVLNSSPDELRAELAYLASLGAISFDGRTIRVRDEGILGAIAARVRGSSFMERLPLYRRYVEGIDEAVAELAGEVGRG